MSSKRRIRRKGCDGKVRHVDQYKAFRHYKDLTRKEPSSRFSIYKCQFCKGWHVGHS